MNKEQLLDDAMTKMDAERDLAIAIATEAQAATGTSVCIDCGDPIPVGRRIAAPWARRCVDCQGWYEAERMAR